MTSDGVEYFPINASKLEKGDVFTHAILYEMFGIRQDHHHSAFAILTLKDRIRKAARRAGMNLTLRIKEGEIHICSDSEAAEYNRRLGKWGIRKIRRGHIQNLGVDVSQLNEAERKAHERTVLRSGQMISSITSIQNRNILPSPKQRETPGLSALEAPKND
jgi:hypothetical protein